MTSCGHCGCLHSGPCTGITSRDLTRPSATAVAYQISDVLQHVTSARWMVERMLGLGAISQASANEILDPLSCAIGVLRDEALGVAQMRAARE